MPIISIIVPVYKVENYLDACIESILNQTFRDFELILVDDGSPDRCGAICESWACRDNRIKVIHKENGGLSSARNAALDIATGEYIGFVDSDDTVHPQMYELLHYYAEKDGSDIVGQRRWQAIKKEVYDFEMEDAPCVVMSSREALENYHNVVNGLFWMTVMTKLFRRDIFQNLRFREGIIFEDEDIMPQILQNAQKITIIPHHIYNYTFSPNSIMRSDFSPKKYMVLGVWKRHIMFFHDLCLCAPRDYYAVMYLYELLRLYKTTYYEHPEFLETFSVQINDFLKFRPYIRKNCKLTRLQRALLEIFPAMPKLAVKIYNVLNK